MYNLSMRSSTTNITKFIRGADENYHLSDKPTGYSEIEVIHILSGLMITDPRESAGTVQFIIERVDDGE